MRNETWNDRAKEEAGFIEASSHVGCYQNKEKNKSSDHRMMIEIGEKLENFHVLEKWVIGSEARRRL